MTAFASMPLGLLKAVSTGVAGQGQCRMLSDPPLVTLSQLEPP